MNNRPGYILPLLVFAQFAGTSLWFAGNAILDQLAAEGNELSIGWITSMVQMGFIAGTLVFAVFSIADRYSPSRIFLLSCVTAAVVNLLIIPLASSGVGVAVIRFLTGFCLAGIYPVGMKIASDWYREGLGRALSFLLAALVLGTAFPHLLRAGIFHLDWKSTLITISVMAIVGGLVVSLVVKDGPGSVHRDGKSGKFAFFQLFWESAFRKYAFGYFGHMWELYSFWAFVPLFLLSYGITKDQASLWTFLVIATGAVGCMVGGLASGKFGNARVASAALLVSGSCCLLSGVFYQLPWLGFLVSMLAWGAAVIADSPQFSALIANSAPPHLKGTALSIVTSLGFSITIISIAVLETVVLQDLLPVEWAFLVLSPGPLLGLMAMFSGARKK